MPTHATYNLQTIATNYAAYRNEFQKARKGYAPPQAPSPDVGDSMVGYITLGTKEIAVEQVDGHWPPYTMVRASRIWPHDPRPLPDGRVYISRFTPEFYPAPLGMKYCTDEGHWMPKEDFSPDKRARDGLHSHCKMCRNRHAKRMYWLEKEAKQWNKQKNPASVPFVTDKVGLSVQVVLAAAQ